MVTDTGYAETMKPPWRDLEERLEFENEADRPLRESGEGESEGFEESERDLIHQTEDTAAGQNPKYDAGLPEEEQTDPEVYGEADEVLSSEEPDSDYDG
ncbi:MAG: hypothetical protein BGO23_03020 [Solirubrobacterales bacterium 67-14]|nr:MAG: hypothetical protein BGO23_03020 [Solirubrobacterales bacterium 67-14]